MFELKNNTSISYNVYKVPRDYVMRPDLISKAVYNNSLYAEVLLKYNGISNPFSINENDLILIPDLDSANAKIKSEAADKKESRAERIRNTYKYIDPLKIPSKGEILKKYNERQIVDTQADSLPPNFTEPGTSQVTYRGGRVYFGEGVETCLKNGMSTGEFLTNVITNRKKTNTNK
ncbi:MAG TPA: hypothetical protein VMZ29_01535 [Candidatus Bathyarchaeia archaeon]|nr:hypothetical protein [Candidatus Bathyarchaeia archaeon]